jgi:hypothetical protein
MAVLAAVLAAGLEHQKLPFDGSSAGDLGIAGSAQATAVARALRDMLSAHPALLAEAALFAAAAAALPYCRRRGLWLAAGFGAGFLAATVLAAPSAPLLPLAASAWLTAAVLALEQPQSGAPNDGKQVGKRGITLDRRGR